MKRIVLPVILAIVLVSVPAVGVRAATSQDVTVTAVPSFISISNSPSDWTINGITGDGVISENTTYYSNPLGDTTSPSGTVADGECRFTVTNNGTAAINIVVNFPNFTGGDAMTNGDSGSAGATSFGAYSYYSGMTYSSKVVAQASGSANLYSSLAAAADLKWGLEITTQQNAWTSGTSMSSTVTITATAAG